MRTKQQGIRAIQQRIITAIEAEEEAVDAVKGCLSRREYRRAAHFATNAAYHHAIAEQLRWTLQG